MTPISAVASIPPAEPAARPAEPASAPAAEKERGLWDRLWGKEGFSFGALLDIVNPLQHIPVVSTIYRAATGDTIGPAPRMMGGALFGGVIGLIASAADSALEAVTGKDTGSHVLAMLPEPTAPSETTTWASIEDRRGQRWEGGTPINGPTSRTMLASAPEVSPPAAATTGEPAVSAAAPEIAPAFAPGSNTTAAVPANHPLNAQPRTAQLGAGGRQIPLTAKGHAGATPVALPTPQSLAADPALLRDLRQGGAAAATNASATGTNATSPAGTGRIDTAIKGRGLVAPAADTRAANGGTNWLDYAASDPRATALDAESRDKDKPTAPKGTTAIPEVGPDFLMKMQQALDKYQAMRNGPAPTVDLSH